MTVREWLTDAEKVVDRAEARILLAYRLGWDRAQIMARLDEHIPAQLMDTLAADVREISGSWPLAYIMGHREFYGRKFVVSQDVLIPRADTETLIEVAIALDMPGARVLDIGTGSGCIAITLAAERRDWDVVGVDISYDAIAVARANQHQLKVPLALEVSDLFENAPGPWDLVVSNPPYIGRAEQLPGPVFNAEPHLALFAEENGHAMYRRLADEGRAHTNLMLVEIGYLQAQSVPAIFAEYGWTLEQRKADLNGIERAQLFRQ